MQNKVTHIYVIYKNEHNFDWQGKFTQIADDPETLRIKANSEVFFKSYCLVALPLKKVRCVRRRFQQLYLTKVITTRIVFHYNEI